MLKCWISTSCLRTYFSTISSLLVSSSTDLFLQESANNASLLVPLFGSGAPTEGRGRSPHGFQRAALPSTLHNLRRKYIQDIAFPPKDTLRRSVKATRGPNRLREIHAGGWKHCGKRGCLYGGDAEVWIVRVRGGASPAWMRCAALPLLWCGQRALLL